MLKTKIEEIEKVLSTNDYILEKEKINLGVSNGILGLSLFYYYYYLYTKEEWCLEKLMSYLSKTIEGINDQYKGSFIVLDMIQISKFLYFLKEENLIDDDVNEYCEGFDVWIDKFLDLKIGEKQIDSYGGVLRAGDYFLSRRKDINVDIQIDKIVSLIEQISIENKDSQEVYFDCKFRDEKTIEVGKAHGISGVIYFLLRLYDTGFYKERCLKLLQPSLKYLTKKMKISNVNFFPFDLDNTRPITYSNLNYGDIGVGYTLFHAGRVLNNELYKNKGIETILNFAKVRDDDAKKVYDANLLYGSSGIYSIMSLFSEYTTHKTVKESCEYWFKRTVEFGRNDTKWAGYQSNYNPEYDELQVSFDQGIAGIGIVFICAELGLPHKYLNFMNYNFF